MNPIEPRMRPGHRIRASRSIALCIALAATLGVGTTAAHAHSFVERTEPAEDAVVRGELERVLIFFREPVEVAFGALRVLDPSGEPVQRGPVRHLPGRPEAIAVMLGDGLDDGPYEVRWRVIASDGHPIEGTFGFELDLPNQGRPASVAGREASEGQHDESGGAEAGGSGMGEPEAGGMEAPPHLAIGYGVFRGLNLLGLVLLAGGWLFGVLIWRRPGRTLALRPGQTEDRFLRGWRRMLLVGWALVLLATLFNVLFQTAIAAEVSLREAASADLLRELLRTRFGVVQSVKLALLALILPPLVLTLHRWRSASSARTEETRWPVGVGAAGVHPPLPKAPLVAASVLTLALLATPGSAGHAGATSPVAVSITADLLHILAGSVWLGGLLALILVAFPATRGHSDGERVRLLAPVISRFSDIAVVAIAVLVATGAYRAWSEIGNLGALTGTDYGLTFLLKMAAFAPALALGGINNRFTKPRIARAASEADVDPKPLWRLRRLVIGEILLGFTIIGITALLVQLTPARMAVSGG